MLATPAGLGAATSKLGLSTGAVLDPCVYAFYRTNFRIDNYDASAVNVNTLTVRYWFNNASAVTMSTGFLLYIYNSSGTYQGFASITPTRTAMGSTCTLGGRSANQYMDLTFSSFSIPAGGYASPNGGYVDMTLSGGGVFDAACDDYSTTNSGGFNQISRMAVYQSGSLVCEYLNSSTQDPNTGVEPCGGTSGCGAAASPTPTATPSASPSPSPSPAYSPTFSPAPSPVQSPTRTATPTATPTRTPVLSPTPTATPTASPAVYQSPTYTRTPTMRLQKSANVSTAILGDTITFYLDWTNDAGVGVSYQIWDTISPYLSYLGCDSGCSVSGGMVQWNIAAGAGTSGQVAFWATVSGMP